MAIISDNKSQAPALESLHGEKVQSSLCCSICDPFNVSMPLNFLMRSTCPNPVSAYCNLTNRGVDEGAGTNLKPALYAETEVQSPRAFELST
jgi:hypothetical protein